MVFRCAGVQLLYACMPFSKCMKTWIASVSISGECSGAYLETCTDYASTPRDYALARRRRGSDSRCVPAELGGNSFSILSEHSVWKDDKESCARI